LAEACRCEGHSQAPDSAARAYLTVIAREPAVVRRALDNPAGGKIAGATRA
jgi:hypothetical protein